MPSHCSACKQLCCKYITVKIETPKTISEFDILYWYLLHKDVHIFKDNTGWYLMAFNDCLQMKNGKCNDYENRPYTCREHSSENCQKDQEVKDTVDLYLESIHDLNIYCNKRFKKWKERHKDL